MLKSESHQSVPTAQTQPKRTPKPQVVHPSCTAPIYNKSIMPCSARSGGSVHVLLWSLPCHVVHRLISTDQGSFRTESTYTQRAVHMFVAGSPAGCRPRRLCDASVHNTCLGIASNLTCWQSRCHRDKLHCNQF